MTPSLLLSPLRLSLRLLRCPHRRRTTPQLTPARAVVVPPSAGPAPGLPPTAASSFPIAAALHRSVPPAALRWFPLPPEPRRSPEVGDEGERAVALCLFALAQIDATANHSLTIAKIGCTTDPSLFLAIDAAAPHPSYHHDEASAFEGSCCVERVWSWIFLVLTRPKAMNSQANIPLEEKSLHALLC